MRIVLVLEDLNDTGANRVSLDRAARWSRAGETVTVFVAAAVAEGSVPVPAGLDVVRGARGRRLRSVLPISLWRLLRRARSADVVVAGTEVGFALLLAWLATRVARRPFAVTVQSQIDRAVENYVSPRLRPATRAALRGTALAVCVAHGLVPSTAAATGQSTRVRAAPNAVPRDEIRAAAALEPRIELDDTRPMIVGVGRLVRQKGFDLLVRAHALALADGAPAHQLMIIGEGSDERDSLVDLAEELDVAGAVTLAGFVANPHAVVARASAFVLSSRWEGFSLCLAEALACATPCIAYDCLAGPAEVLDHGRFGQLVPPEDARALADAIREHLLEPQLLAAKARLAADQSLPIFDPAAAAAEHLSELKALKRA